MKTPVKECPISFGSEMIRAILGGKKAQFRRVIDPQPNNPETFGISPVWGWGVPLGMNHFCVHAAFNEGGRRVDRHLSCPYGKSGDRLWVRETFRDLEDPGAPHAEVRRTIRDEDGETHYIVVDYKSTDRQNRIIDKIGEPGWKSSIFMPRWASRLLLEISKIRVQRLQEISAQEALAEGHKNFFYGSYDRDFGSKAPSLMNFLRTWDATDGRKSGCSWEDNPWVWVIEFRVIES